MAETGDGKTFRYRFEFYLIKAVFSVLHLVPFRQRSALMATAMSRVVAPLVGYKKRVHRNLSLVWPDLSPREKDAMTVQVNRNVGRTICELFSPKDLLSMVHKTPLSGPGLAALETARAANQPAIVVSAHFGNYDIVRGRLIADGFNVGALYRRMNNPFFHDYYLSNISTIGSPLFERGRPGLSEMIRHLKSGGVLAALSDVRANGGVPLPFFGHAALTATSMAEMALRYNAVLIPFYGTRQPDGYSFTAELEAPIPHSDPETMTRALTASLEARVLKDPEQWFWIHNRWKGGAA